MSTKNRLTKKDKIIIAFLVLVLLPAMIYSGYHAAVALDEITRWKF